jgi:hypothetical protein
VVAETFLDMKDVMKSAYYADKIPQYWEDIKSGNRTVARMWTIRKALINSMKQYNVKKVGAYNMAFDKRALNNLMRYVSKSWCRWFFPYGTEFFDIWNCACELILARKSYIDFAIKNGLVSSCDNILTSAECAYKYITKNLDFKEEHKGLEDCEIEVAILAECYKQHKKMDTTINPSCWRKVQRKRQQPCSVMQKLVDVARRDHHVRDCMQIRLHVFARSLHDDRMQIHDRRHTDRQNRYAERPQA